MQGPRHDVAVGCEPLVERVVYAALVHVADRHCRAARLPGHGRGQEPDCPCAEDQGCGTSLWPRAVTGVYGDGERLEESGCVE